MLTPARTISVFFAFRHMLTQCAHFTTLMFQGRLSKSLHQVVLADLPYLSAKETTYTTWTSCHQLTHILLRVCSSRSGGMTIPQSNTQHVLAGVHLLRQFQSQASIATEALVRPC